METKEPIHSIFMLIELLNQSFEILLQPLNLLVIPYPPIDRNPFEQREIYHEMHNIQHFNMQFLI